MSISKPNIGDFNWGVALNSTLDELDIEKLDKVAAAATYVPSQIAVGAGFDPTGATSSVVALQALIDKVRDSVRSGGLLVNNTVTIPGGTYDLGTVGLIIPPYVKLLLLGSVVFRYSGTGTAVWITPSVGDPAPLYNKIAKQSYNNAPMFQGGGLIISGPGTTTFAPEQNAGVGLEVGARDGGPTAARPMSRYSIDNVAISGFTGGLRLNAFNHFIGQYRNLHLELNSFNLIFGSGPKDDAGENFHFEHCTFAGSQTGVRVRSPGFDATFTACSFDYMDRAVTIVSGAGFGSLTFNGGHIEAITAESETPVYSTSTGSTVGGVVVGEGTVQNEYINFRSTTILTRGSDPLFRGTVTVAGEVLLRPFGDTPKPAGFFAAAAGANATHLKNRYFSERKAISRDHNLLIDPTFARATVGAITSTPGSLYGWDQTFDGVVTPSVVAGAGHEGGNAYRLTLNPGASATMTASNAIPLRELDDFYAGVILKPGLGVNVAGGATYLRHDATTITTAFVALGTTNLAAGSYASPFMFKVNTGATVAPMGTVSSVRPRFLISNPSASTLTVDVGLLYFGS